MTLICAGEAFEDLIFVGLDRLPELGEEIKTDRFHATVGGGAVITAVKAARLGMRTELISALSDSACRRLRNERLTITNLREPNEPHAITVALSTGEDRAFVTYNGINSQLETRLARIFSRKLTADSRKLKPAYPSASTNSGSSVICASGAALKSISRSNVKQSAR